MSDHQTARDGQERPNHVNRIGTQDGRGLEIRNLYVCTVRGRSGSNVSVRFGAESVADGEAGAKEFACIWFEETGREYLQYVPDARPHPEDATVQITLLDEVTGHEHSFPYEVPLEFQLNSHIQEQGAFYRV